MKNVKLIRLLTGEEILADVISESDEILRINNPIRVMLMPGKQGNAAPTVGFAPWMEFSEDTEFSLDKSHVLVMMNPIAEFVTQYNKAFSGLVLPENEGKLILPS